MSNIYTVSLCHGNVFRKYSSVVELSSDFDAIKVGRLLIEAEAQRRPDPDTLVMLVGRGSGEGTVWLGSWHWNGAPEWFA